MEAAVELKITLFPDICILGISVFSMVLYHRDDGGK